MIVRSARLSDASSIAQFNLALAEETEGVTLRWDVVLQGVSRALTEQLGANYLVAEVDGEVVGQLMTTREWSDWRNGWYVWLQSVYVEHAFRGRGVFRSLLKQVLQDAAAEGDVYSLRLYVEQGNKTALRAYENLGFSGSGYEVLEQTIRRTEQEL